MFKKFDKIRFGKSNFDFIGIVSEIFNDKLIVLGMERNCNLFPEFLSIKLPICSISSLDELTDDEWTYFIKYEPGFGGIIIQ